MPPPAALTIRLIAAFDLAVTALFALPFTAPAFVNTLYALDRAQSVLAELASRQVSMHISVDEDTSRIHVELRDGEGRLIREVPASHATGMLSGERPVGWLSR